MTSGREPIVGMASKLNMSRLSRCLDIPIARRLASLLAMVVAASMATSSPALAEAPTLVKAMLENVPEGAENRCSYVRTRISAGGETKRERYHAGELINSWELLEVNGREPNAAELRRYSRDEDHADRRHPLDFDLREMVDPDHWRLRSESEDEAVFEFRLRPNEDLDERLVAKVQGVLVLDKKRLQPVRIAIENTEPAYIAPLVRVAEYSQEMHFRWEPAIGAAVLSEIETHTRGRAVGLKVLRRHKLVRYSDYQCRGAVADASG